MLVSTFGEQKYPGGTMVAINSLKQCGGSASDAVKQQWGHGGQYYWVALVMGTRCTSGKTGHCTIK